MSSERDDDKSVNTDHNVPVNSAGDPIIYMGNPATVPGLLYQIEEWSSETQRYDLLVKHNIVLYKDTLYAEDNVAVNFHKGTVPELTEYSFKEPCPATPARIKNQAFKSGKEPPNTKPPDSDQYKVVPEVVQRHDGLFFQALKHAAWLAASAATSGRRRAQSNSRPCQT